MKNDKKIHFLDLRKTFGSNDGAYGTEVFKRLDVGLGSGLITTDNLSWNIGPCRFHIKPKNDPIYFFAKCSKKSNEAELVMSEMHLNDSEESYLVLLKKTDYQSLSF